MNQVEQRQTQLDTLDILLSILDDHTEKLIFLMDKLDRVSWGLNETRKSR